MNLSDAPDQVDWKAAAMLAVEQRNVAREQLQQIRDLCTEGWSDFNGLAMVAVADLHTILDGPL